MGPLFVKYSESECGCSGAKRVVGSLATWPQQQLPMQRGYLECFATGPAVNEVSRAGTVHSMKAGHACLLPLAGCWAGGAAVVWTYLTGFRALWQVRVVMHVSARSSVLAASRAEAATI
jgi:hypothetical protein